LFVRKIEKSWSKRRTRDPVFTTPEIRREGRVCSVISNLEGSDKQLFAVGSFEGGRSSFIPVALKGTNDTKQYNRNNFVIGNYGRNRMSAFMDNLAWIGLRILESELDIGLFTKAAKEEKTSLTSITKRYCNDV
jgi:hypothetical protein